MHKLIKSDQKIFVCLFVFAEILKPILKSIRNYRGVLDSQSSIEKEGQSGDSYSQFQNLQQNYSNHNSIVLA